LREREKIMFNKKRSMKVDIIGLEVLSNVLNYLGFEYSVKRIENTLDWLVCANINSKDVCEIKKLGYLNNKFRDHVEFV